MITSKLYAKNDSDNLLRSHVLNITMVFYRRLLKRSLVNVGNPQARDTSLQKSLRIIIYSYKNS